MVSTTTVEAEAASVTTGRRTRRKRSPYPLWFHIPGGVLFIVLFAVPTFASFYFSLTRWTLFDTEFIGLENYKLFFTEPMMVTGFVNTFIYGVAHLSSQGRARAGCWACCSPRRSLPAGICAPWCSSRSWCPRSASASPSRS